MAVIFFHSFLLFHGLVPVSFPSILFVLVSFDTLFSLYFQVSWMRRENSTHGVSAISFRPLIIVLCRPLLAERC